MSGSGAHPFRARGFTLVELLVVIAVIGLLAALLLPALASAQRAGRRAACISNLRQIGIAIHTYAQDSDGRIPYGPQAPPFTSPANFYPSTGAPTSLLSLQSGAPAGLGLLLRDQLTGQRGVLFCPDSDQRVDAQAELAKVGFSQAQGSYYYRHGGNTRLFDDPLSPPPTDHLRLEALGLNRANEPIRALALDSQFLCPPEIAAYKVKPRTHHDRATVNILGADGAVVSRQNKDDRFTVDVRNYAEIRDAFGKILGALEHADAAF